jgi:hypothetical protein
MAVQRKQAEQCAQPDPASDQQQLWDNFFNTSTSRHEVMTRERLKEKVLRIIVSGNLPFAFVENAEFQSLCADAYPDCIPLPNRRTMRDYLKAKAEESKAQLKERLRNNDSKVNLVLDVWTTRSNLAFLGNYPLPPCNGLITRFCYWRLFPVTHPFPVTWACNGLPDFSLETITIPVTLR